MNWIKKHIIKFEITVAIVTGVVGLASVIYGVTAGVVLLIYPIILGIRLWHNHNTRGEEK